MADAWFLHRGQILFLSASPRVPAGFDPVDGEDAVLLLRELASSHLHELRRALPPPRPAAWLQSLQSLPQGLGDGLHLYRRRDLRLSPLLVEEPVVDLADLADDVVEPQQHWVEVRMLDADGEPLVDAPCRIEGPDGTVVEGRTDGDGKLRVDEITAAGPCKITFPALRDYVLETSAEA